MELNYQSLIVLTANSATFRAPSIIFGRASMVMVLSSWYIVHTYITLCQKHFLWEPILVINFRGCLIVWPCISGMAAVVIFFYTRGHFETKATHVDAGILLDRLLCSHLLRFTYFILMAYLDIVEKGTASSPKVVVIAALAANVALDISAG
jgi:hypothetical protein